MLIRHFSSDSPNPDCSIGIYEDADALYTTYNCMNWGNGTVTPNDTFKNYYTSFESKYVYTSNVDGQDVVFTASHVRHNLTAADAMVTLGVDGLATRPTSTDQAGPSTSNTSSTTTQGNGTTTLSEPRRSAPSSRAHLGGPQIAGIALGSLGFLVVVGFVILLVKWWFRLRSKGIPERDIQQQTTHKNRDPHAGDGDGMMSLPGLPRSATQSRSLNSHARQSSGFRSSYIPGMF